jgi:hypothetical protein
LFRRTPFHSDHQLAIGGGPWGNALPFQPRLTLGLRKKKSKYPITMEPVLA